MPDPAAPGHPRFAGRVAFVTGAGSGIGEAVARTLYAQGASVAATDIHGGSVTGLAERLTGREHPEGAPTPGRFLPLALDVSDPGAVRAAVAGAVAALGPVDILVNVAGVLHTGPATGMDDDAWARLFAVNATGVFHTAREIAPAMAGRGRGSIVTVASDAAAVPRVGMAGYAASKAAATMFTKCLGLEYARSGVRCNVVAPGSTDTPMQRSLWDGDDVPHRVLEGDPSGYRNAIPLGRIADPADVAEAVAFLASDEARHITMQQLYVDGGASLR
ncbi:2,3-dihydro-2,3-dihydroxybenzoate dehydrogenase [Streptomyces sp. NPDC004311]|uniref:2,3-dihydro-2,3-dihydroxybenzoate dehydrogenase n=1 Tax=Streptomyces sp. NPDC004311 TaxID=3364698 RepID=UPI0036849EBF